MKNKIFKVLKFTIVIIVTVCILGLIGVFIYINYKSKNWMAPDKIEGVSLGMTRSDVLFYQDKDVTYYPKGEIESAKRIGIAKYPNSFSDEKILAVSMSFTKSDTVDYIAVHNIDKFYSLKGDGGIPFTTTAKLTEYLGQPDIFAESTLNDLRYRRYTYLDTGYSFTYVHDELHGFSLGKVGWRAGWGKTIKYSIMGQEICPSSNCPFDDEENIKDEFKDKDYRHFLN